METISCLTITRAPRLAALGRAMRAFARQTWPSRELIVVHDGGDGLQRAIQSLADEFTSCDVRVHREPAGRPLGALRNVSVEQARGDLVCQWDDDDLYHPERLERQARRLLDERADFCFLTDQMHLFIETGEMYWDDWTVERPPMHLIQGTLFGYRDRIGRYPEIARGEDTSLVLDLLRRGSRLTGLGDVGWLYVYVYDGQNAFEKKHHARISQWKRRGRDVIVSRRNELVARLREHEWPIPLVFMPYEGGRLHVVLPPRPAR